MQKSNVVTAAMTGKRVKGKKNPRIAQQLHAVDKYVNVQFKTDADKVTKDIDDKFAQLFVSL
jgi:hypothetical protein